MPSESTAPYQMPPAHTLLVPESDAVVLEGIHEQLITFAVQLAYIHYLLFGLPLVLVGANGAPGCIHPFHETGRALDLRLQDKDEVETNLFLAILAFAAPHQACAFCDERIRPGVTYVHLEYRGV